MQTMNNDLNENLEEIEDELKQSENEKETLHKVSGHSVFDIERILKEKGEKAQDEKEKE
jgi:hypothetical protein